MRRPRQERASNAVFSTSRHDAVSLKEPSTHSVRLSRMLAPANLTFTSSTTPQAITIDAPAVAAATAMYDRYILHGVKLRFYWNSTVSQTHTGYGHSWAVCFDPTQDTGGTLTDAASVGGYANARIFTLTPSEAIFEYEIKNPTHEVIGSTGSAVSRDPVETENSWRAGYAYLVPFVGTHGVTSVITYSLELDIEYIAPRIKN